MLYPTIEWNDGFFINERSFPNENEIQEVIFVLRSSGPEFSTVKKTVFQKKLLKFSIDEKRTAMVFVYLSDVALRNFLHDEDIQHYMQSVAPWLFTYGNRQSKVDLLIEP